MQRVSGFGLQQETELASRRNRQETLGCHRRNTGPVVAEQSAKEQIRRLSSGSVAEKAESDRVLAMSNPKVVRKSAEEARRLDHYLTYAAVRVAEGCELFKQHQAHGPLPVTGPVAYAYLKILYKRTGGVASAEIKGYRAVLNAQATEEFPMPFTTAADNTTLAL